MSNEQRIINAYQEGRQRLPPPQPNAEAEAAKRAVDYKVKGGYLSASDLLKCDRLNAYKYHGIQPSDERTLTSSTAAAAGIRLEEEIVKALELGGIKVENRSGRAKSNINTIPVSGRIDGELPMFNELLEIKTVASKHFDRVQDFGRPLPWNTPQGEFYMRALKRESVRFVYLCRDTGRITAPLLTPDAKLWERIGRGVARVAASDAPEEIQPIRIPLCDFCTYRSLCWGTQEQPTGRGSNGTSERSDALTRRLE